MTNLSGKHGENFWQVYYLVPIPMSNFESHVTSLNFLFNLGGNFQLKNTGLTAKDTKIYT